jgi:hypothetical protein
VEPVPEAAAPGGLQEQPWEPEAARVPFAVSVLPMVSTAGPGRHAHALSLNLLVGSSWIVHGAELGTVLNLTEREVRGAQLAGVGNILDGELTGYQAAGVFNIVGGRTRSLQAAGVFNLGPGPVSGLQAAGVFNLLEGPLSGAQLAGVFNRAEEVNGAQVGLVNISAEVRGGQVGLVNVATGEVRGTQVGLVNVARSVRGLPVGLVNVSQQGGFSWSGWITDDGYGYTGLQMSSGLVYTLLYGGTQLAGAPSLFAAGLGMGLRVPAGPFAVETDFSLQHAFEGAPQNWGAGFATGYSPLFPTARFLVGWKVFRSLVLFGGVVLNGHIPGGTLRTPLHTGTPLNLQFSSGSLELYPKLVAGLRV